DVTRRFVDYIDSLFGPGKRTTTPGHPEIELALMKLYRATGEQRYFDLAQFFIDQRGHNMWHISNPDYYQDRVPVREAVQVEGHVVRQLYLLSAVADVYMETGEQALLEAMHTQWHDMVGGKLSLTGGVGARHDGESFGEPYELPNDHCYCETCAAISSIMWNWRLLQITGDSRYADLMERTLYNGFLSGLSLGGTGYFYINPLLSRGDYGRQEWYSCACCPPNAMRLIASLAQYVATRSENGLQLHHYIPTAIEHDSIQLAVETGYPWNGQVSIVVEQTSSTPWTLQLRIPAWCDSPRLEINDAKQAIDIAENGYLQLERQWQPGDRITLQLPMSPRLTTAHPYVDPTRGSVAIEYGPLVYCMEQIDQQANVFDLVLDTTQPLTSEWQPELLDGTVTIQGDGFARENSVWGDVLYRPLDQIDAAQKPVKINAIPYHLWGNRENGPMRVWIAKA
ncbi:MAG: glycoside hydrolase family 127 protein, partial [Anaerolineae bacterium]|nr:glycoside hydrolase family 127 protein [Anaerolineae bacterium]